jgi:hypothetical protein
LALEE